MKLSTREEPQTDAQSGSVGPAVPSGALTVARAARPGPGPEAALPARATDTAEPALLARAADTGASAAPVRDPAVAGGNAAIARLATGRAPHPVHLGVLAPGGGHALRRLHAQPKLTVSQPGDRFEREADAVATQVGLGRDAQASAGPAPGLSRLATPAAAPGDPGAEAPPGLSALLADPGPGVPIPPDVRARVEATLRFDLGGVQVHSSERAAAGAAQLNARAFTTGGHIFLGAGESASDLALMAHEATHVVQQQSVGVYRLGLQRDSDSLLPDWALAPLRSAVHAIPGYDMLTVVAGYDPIANRNVERTPENLVRGVLGLVPFGGVVAGKLQEMGVLQDAFRMIDSGLAAHNLTLARFQTEVDQAWSEISVTKGIDGNVAVVTRHVDGLYNDALGFVRGIIDAVVQLIRDAAVGFAEKYLVGTPVWDLTKKVLHTDPLRGTPVNAPTVEILADFLKLIGKQDALAQMQERGTLQKTADWLDLQVPRFLGLINDLIALFQAGWNAIQPENIANLADNLSKLARDAIGLVQRIGAFAYDVIGTVLSLIKDALLDWLSRHAHQTRGFKLLTVIIGMDPFTGAPVPRSAENLIGGFITLLPNGEATYQKLAEAGVIADAAAQIEGAMTRLGISADMIKNTFLGVWNMLTLEDLLNPLGAFLRVLDKFGEPLGRIVAFVGEVLKVVVTLILKLMEFPSELLGSIVANAMAAIEDIKRDPVAFFLNLLQALKTGLFAFLDKVLTYLLNGLADWLFRGLAKIGIQKPPDLSLKSILNLVLQVLGITTEMLWQKLGKTIGEENVRKIRAGLAMAGEAWEFIKDVQENGVAAIWKHVESQLGNLWDTLLGIVMDWITKEIVEKATAKLLSMLDPTGIMAVVNSTIAFFKAVQSVIDYVREILQIINDYVSTLAAIAKGDIQSGAAKVEKGLANAVPVAIGFLANQAGLGSVPEELAEHVKELQKVIDEAVEWLFAKAKSMGQAALNALGVGGGADGQPPPAATGVKGKAEQEVTARIGQGIGRDDLDVALAEILTRLRPEGLHDLRAVDRNEQTAVVATASPTDDLLNLAPEKVACRIDVTIKLEGDQPATAGILAPFNTIRRPNAAGEWVDEEGKVVSDPRTAAPTPVRTTLDPVQVENAARFPGQPTREPRLRTGGILVPPSAEDPNTIKLEAWNTGERPYDFATNSSHAEPQLHRWIRDKTTSEWKGRVIEVEIKITLTPCTMCTENVVEIAKMLTDAKDPGKTIKLVLSADKWYVGKGANKDLSTTDASWALVRAAWPQGTSPAPQKQGKLAVAKK
ncbi:DUF4157 domain-containing protein [Krasilnikovia cinnamomea]|uniref:eCIS core domain-containing protein n=1 Tax=Krasilnikovia cinnamomea TaxID=349313 RepID=UPI00102B81F4|nr:DUF4157 domain-containing protein [Krasilnikovia cinnamomea]